MIVAVEYRATDFLWFTVYQVWIDEELKATFILLEDARKFELEERSRVHDSQGN